MPSAIHRRQCRKNAPIRCKQRESVVNLLGGVVKLLEFPLVVFYVKLPFALEFHDHFKGLSDASFATRARADVVCDGLDFFNGIAWTCAAAAGNHNRDVRKVVAKVHHFLSFKGVFVAEMLEVLDLGPAAEIYVLLGNGAGAESLSDAFGYASRDYSDRVALHVGHPQSEGILGVEDAEKVAVGGCKNAAVGEHSVYVKDECFDFLKPFFHNDL